MTLTYEKRIFVERNNVATAEYLYMYLLNGNSQLGIYDHILESHISNSIYSSLEIFRKDST